ncbi:MAG: hypothetical protein U1G07_10725 [Verrucomicrobiota bacterium]
MSTLSKAFLALAVLSLVIAFVGRHHAITNGLGKAFFGVFLIGVFIDGLFGEKSTS